VVYLRFWYPDHGNTAAQGARSGAGTPQLFNCGGLQRRLVYNLVAQRRRGRG
jgi:hypothetical protein